MFPTFREWRTQAQKRFDDLRAEGLVVVKLVIDPEEPLAWANSEGRVINGHARAEFAALVHEREKPQRSWR